MQKEIKFWNIFLELFSDIPIIIKINDTYKFFHTTSKIVLYFFSWSDDINKENKSSLKNIFVSVEKMVTQFLFIFRESFVNVTLSLVSSRNILSTTTTTKIFCLINHLWKIKSENVAWS